MIRYGKRILLTTICILLLVSLFINTSFTENTATVRADLSTEEVVALGAFPVVVPTMKWGFAIDTLVVESFEVQN